jgi:transposase
MVEVTALAKAEEDNGWAVLATTVSTEACTDAEILQAYQEQNTTVEPGFRWIKNPAAIAPVWLEKPERIAALAMLTVLGLLVYSIIKRQVRLYLRTHNQRLRRKFCVGDREPAVTPVGGEITRPGSRTVRPQ